MRQKSKGPKKKIYWIVIIVLILIFIGVNYISIKDKRAKLHEKQVVAEKQVAKPDVHPVTFSANTSKATTAPASVKYMVQVASVGKRQAAHVWQEHLAKLGYHSRLEVVHSGQATHYRVQLGPYAQQAQANDVKNTLKKHGVSSLIIQQ